MTQEKRTAEKGARGPNGKLLILLLLGIGAFQIIAALLASLLWLTGVAWDSYLVAIAAVSIVLTVPVVLIYVGNTRA